MKRATLIFLLLLGYQALSGQGAKYIIRNYDLMSEVRLNGSTWAMVQDTNGILYFGADYGVAMYNGAYWELASRGQSIVRSLLCSSQKKIVYGGFDDFGFLDHEISIGTVFNSLASQLPDSLRVFGDIWSICEVDGKLFFQAKSKIFVYENGKINAFPVSDCYHRGFVMSGSYLINQAGIGLTAFSGNAFTPVNGGEFFSDKVISSMIEMADGRILIGCRNFGFFLFDPLTGSVRESFPSHPETNKELSIKKIYHGILLPDGNLAVATLSGGTYLIDPEGNILKVINRNHGLRDNVNYFLGLSKDSNLWICTSNGVSAFNVNSPFILWDYTSGIDGVVLDMIDYQGHVYVGTLTGLYEISTGEIDQVRFEKGAESLLHTEVWSLLRVDRNGRSMLFLGSGNGLYQLNQSQPVLLKGGEAILKLKQPRSNPDILLAIHSDNIDVYRWDGTTFGYEANIRNQFNGMRTAAEDDKGNLWIGTRSAGVVKIPIDDLIGQGVVKYSFDGVLTDVIEYQGQVVFSNQGGLFSLNYSTELLKSASCLVLK
jgi:ligand-binding sensor domain-containing protein